MLIDRYMPSYDVREGHELAVGATPEEIDPLIRDLDMSGSAVIRFLFALRGLPQDSVRLEGLKRVGFKVLEQEPGDELVLGLIGRFWKWRERPRRFEPAEFTRFAEAGCAKTVWNFKLVPTTPRRTLIRTETRVLCTDAESRSAFLRYWRLIRPFSGLIRREGLRGIRGKAEAMAARRS